VRPEGFPGRQWRRCPLPGVRKSLPGYARAVRSCSHAPKRSRLVSRVGAAVAHRTTSTPTFGGGRSTVTASFRWHVLTDESFSRWRGPCPGAHDATGDASLLAGNTARENADWTPARRRCGSAGGGSPSQRRPVRPPWPARAPGSRRSAGDYTV